MPAGTIALTNNSATVTGSGTSFTTELKVNDFVVSTVGGVAYTLGVKSIESNTSLTLMENYTGPSASGQSWTPVPYGTMAAITAQLAAQVTYAIRGLNLDKANWQQVFTAPGNITVSLPDGTSWQGPSWAYMATQFAGKANTSDVLTKADNLNSLTDKATARTNLGLKGAAVLDVGTASGTVAAGNDSRLGTVNGKTGGVISSAVNIAGMIQQTTAGAYFYNTASQTESSGNVNCVGARMAGSSTQWDLTLRYYLVAGSYHCFQVVQNSAETFRVQSNGYAYATTFNPTSDSNLKFNKQFLTNALANTMTTRGMSYNIQNERKVGIIAQDIEKFMPEAVSINTNPVVLEDGTILNETKSLDYSAVAGLHTEALKEIVRLMMLCLEDPDDAKGKLQNLISSINTSMEDQNLIPEPANGERKLTMEWALLNPPSTPVVEDVLAEDTHEISDENGS